MKLKDILSTSDLKETLSEAAKTSAGNALSRALQKDKVKALIQNQAEQQAVSTASTQIADFWHNNKKQIIIGVGVVSLVSAGLVSWLILRGLKKK